MFPAAQFMRVKRNERAIRNYCKDGKLQAGTMLILQHMPNCQQKSGDVEQPNCGKVRGLSKGELHHHSARCASRASEPKPAASARRRRGPRPVCGSESTPDDNAGRAAANLRIS